MKEMTDEEAEYWDDYYTKNQPEIDPDTNGGFAARTFKMVALDRLSENYLLTRAIATHKTPTEIIGELVREKIGHGAEYENSWNIGEAKRTAIAQWEKLSVEFVGKSEPLVALAHIELLYLTP